MRAFCLVSLLTIILPLSTATAADSGPFTVHFEAYERSGKLGGNFIVQNGSNTEYRACSIELGDKRQADRWYLPRNTVIDASGRRSYPTFLFRDRKGVIPPSPANVTRGLVRCSDPQVRQEFNFTGK